MNELNNIVNITPEFDGSDDDDNKLEEAFFWRYKNRKPGEDPITSVIWSDIGQRYCEAQGYEDQPDGSMPDGKSVLHMGINYDWLYREFEARIARTEDDARRAHMTRGERINEAQATVDSLRTTLAAAEDKLRQLIEGKSTARSGMEG